MMRGTELGNSITGGTNTVVSKTIVTGFKVLPSTIDEIKAAYRLSVGQTTQLAKQLKTADFEQSCRNIYTFITGNIRYKKDTPGKEEIRTAARSWADRYTGVDCEDYAILAAAIAKNMGYTPGFEVVGFGNGYAHIYAVIKFLGQSVVIDCTPYMDGLGPIVPFNTRPSGIIEKMEVEILNGLERPQESDFVDRPLYGIAGIGAITRPTQALLDVQSSLIRSELNGLGAAWMPGKLRAIRTGILLNGADDQDLYMGALPYIVDVKENGNMMLAPGTDIVALGEYIGILGAWNQTGYNPNLRVMDLEGIGGLEFDRSHPDAEKQLLEGIGSFFKRLANKIKDGHKKVFKKVVDVHKKITKKTIEFHKKLGKKIGSGIKTFVKNPLHYLNKLNPATIVIRNAVLLAMRVNLFYMAKKLRWGYLTEEQAKAKGYNMDQWHKLRKVISTAEKIFDKLGGDAKNLKSAIIKGGGGLGLGDIEDLGAIGDPATAASTAAASSVIAAIWAVLKKVDFKALFGKNPSKEEAADAAAEVSVPTQTSADGSGPGAESENASTYNAPGEEMATGRRMLSTNVPPGGAMVDEEGNPVNGRQAVQGEEGGSNTMMYMGMAAAVGLILMLK